MSIVLLTGGTGFLGRHVAATLIDRGLQVHAIVRREDPDLAALGVRQFVGDLLTGDALAEAAVGATFAIHCAG
jgi:dihydroflavonol-4-reductase